MSALSLVAVGDDTLEAVEHDGAIWVPVRRMCEVLGINPDNQRVKLGAKPWARTVLITARDTAGRQQAVFALHLDCLPMWLATIERVRPEVEAKLHRFQREARDVLAAHFVGSRPAPPPPAPAAPIDPTLVALEAAFTIRAEQLVHAQRIAAVENRVEGLAETAERALELADRASRAGVQAREVTRRVRAAVGTISRAVQRHCAERGLPFADTFRAGRREIGLRPTKEGGASLQKANLRADQVLRLARFFTSQGVPGCRVVDVEAILNGGDDVEVTA